MAKNDGLLRYKGYTARSEYSSEDRVFYGTILGISDMVDFQSDSAKDLEEEFHKAVDDYLDFCAEIGKEPQKEDLWDYELAVERLAASDPSKLLSWDQVLEEASVTQEELDGMADVELEES